MTELFEQKEDGNYEVKMEVVTGFINSKVNRILKTGFHDIYTELLNRIAEDYDLDPEELHERYVFEVTTVKRRTLKPEEVCQATKKDGSQCTLGKKQGYLYCGVHVKTMNAEQETVPETGTYEPRSEQEVKSTKLKQSQPSAFKKPVNKLTQRVKQNGGGASGGNESRDGGSGVDGGTAADETEATEDQTEEQTGDVEIEIKKIEGDDYIVCGAQIFEIPADFDIENTHLEDLKQVAKRLKSGKISWFE